jgi:hypothetical protein
MTNSFLFLHCACAVAVIRSRVSRTSSRAILARDFVGLTTTSIGNDQASPVMIYPEIRREVETIVCGATAADASASEFCYDMPKLCPR